MSETKEQENITDEQQNEQVSAENVAEEASAAEKPAEEAKEQTIEDKYAELEKQYAELKDNYLRKVADFDNYRKRMIKEKQDAFDYANTAILTDLVAILDDFDRGLAAAADAKEVKAVIDGVKMINKQMHGFLESKYNLSSYCEVGDAFDPNIHEAIASVPGPVEEPVCAEVYLKGYKLKDRVIRHAKVMVHMPAPKAENTADSANAESGEQTEN
ncbi:MAG: nucleotide exchange factor GrpE [Treponemataceae bacterium]|nr:nucleotide exchange factor GrpE [Treponemataceae bacterium]